MHPPFLTNLIDRLRLTRNDIYTILNWMVIILSVALVAWLSVSILHQADFLRDTAYMRFQLLVCIVFMLIFVIEFLMDDRKMHYFWRHIIFFLLAIPYLNIINALNIKLSADAIYFVRFIPLARGVWAGCMVVGYVSRNRITGIFFSYISVLIAFIYFGALIFLAREQGVNPQVQNFWNALWWACSTVTTTGCSIFPVTTAGKITGAILAIMGMIMFPLFTVYITSAVRRQITAPPTIPK